MRTERWGPALLGAALIVALWAPAFDPAVQLYYRDTGRVFYPMKQFIAAHLAHPFWDPWTESGTPILGQISPGLFHPFTLLYAALPFDFAFKLNHFLTLPLAFIGTYLLARRLRVSPWAAACAACAYACGGSMVALSAANLQYALGNATIPLAVWALLRACDGGSLLLASAVLASCMLGGEPQSMVIAGLIGAAWAIAEQRRNVWTVALWGIGALCIAAPAILPALPHIAASARATSGIDKVDRAIFATAPVRLLGVVVPRAFDDMEVDSAMFTEFFSGAEPNAFFDSITLGAPVLLLALFALRRRAGIALVATSALLYASSCNDRVLRAVLPVLRPFRFAEKYAVPAALLLCLAGALGVEEALKSRRLALVAAACAALFVAARFAVPSEAWLTGVAKTHSALAAHDFHETLLFGLLVDAAICAALAAAAWTQRPALLALLFAGNALACSAGFVFTAPVELFHTTPPLAETLLARAGPSEGRWRIRGDLTQILIPSRMSDHRLARFVTAVQVLNPQVHQLAGIESVSEYTPLGDAEYQRHPDDVDRVMGVRYDLRSVAELSASDAERLGYAQMTMSAWVREHPPRPRAFVGEKAATYARPAPDAIHVEADGPGELVVAEHFDEGWRATIDGADAKVQRAEHVALGVPLTAGHHVVELRYRPPYLWAALILAASGTLLLRWFRRSRTSSRSPT